MEAEVVSTSPSAHDKSRGGKEVQKRCKQPQERMQKGANPDTYHQLVHDSFVTRCDITLYLQPSTWVRGDFQTTEHISEGCAGNTPMLGDGRMSTTPYAPGFWPKRQVLNDQQVKVHISKFPQTQRVNDLVSVGTSQVWSRPLPRQNNIRVASSTWYQCPNFSCVANNDCPQAKVKEGANT